MPYSTQVLALPDTLTRMTTSEKRLAILQMSFLRRVATDVPLQKWFSGYPWLLLLALTIMERIYGSQRLLLIELGDKGVWKAIRKAFRKAVDDPAIDLPRTPPSEAVMDQFLTWAAHHEELMDELSRIATLEAVTLAEACGNFPQEADEQVVNLVDVDLRFLIHGDGTFVQPYSQVTEKVNRETGEITTSGSRAKDPSQARIQRKSTDGSLDGKADLRGINNVAVSTYTDYGPVILAVGPAEGAELHEALELLERLHAILGDRMVWLVWDRVITGRVVSDVMARFGLVTVNKNVKAREDAGALRGQAIDQDEAIARFRRQEPLPLGTSVYETTKGHEVVKSVHAHFRTIREGACRHDIYEDDGGLYVARPLRHHEISDHNRAAPEGELFPGDDQRLFKVAPVRAASATRTPGIEVFIGHHGVGPWRMTTTWSFTCPDAPHRVHSFETTWTPHAQPTMPSLSPPKADPFNRIRLIPRSDPRFPKFHGRRNITESLHVSTKRSLGTGMQKGRATRLDTQIQQLQFLCSAIHVNSITEFRLNSPLLRLLGLEPRRA